MQGRFGASASGQASFHDADLDIPAPDAGAAPSYRPRPARRDGVPVRMLAIAGGIAGVAVLGGIGVWALAPHRPATIPLVLAPTGPLKVKPDNPGGMQVVGADEGLLSGKGDAAGAGALAPGAEVPAPQALQAQIAADAAAKAATAARAAPPPAPLSSNPTPATPPAPLTPAAPSAIASARPTAPVAIAPPVPAPGARAPVAAASPATRPGDHPADRPPAAAGTFVQLAAMDSEQAAGVEWQRLAKRMPTVLQGHAPTVVKAERDGHVIWRLRTGGFTDIAAATAFCGEVRAKGAACSLATF